MQDSTPQLRTFFMPGMRLDGNSEHATRMLSVHGLRSATGQTVFEGLSSKRPSDEKLKAIEALDAFMDTISALPDNQTYKADYAWQMVLAMETRFFHFAVEDTKAVSEKMAAFVVRFYDDTCDIMDAGLQQKKLNIVDGLCEKAQYNYDQHYTGARNVPNLRAQDLLKKLQIVDPDLMAKTVVADKIEAALAVSRPPGGYLGPIVRNELVH